eukprot:Em0012g1091a
MGVVQAVQANRLKSALVAGDRATAYQYYNRLRGYNIQPNLKYGPTNGDNSPLHYAAMHGMDALYLELLERGGMPDLTNGDKRNCLHLICLVATRPENRFEMLMYTLESDALRTLDMKHLLRQKDKDGNTALHLAAISGMQPCVELLLRHEADPFIPNVTGETPADCATSNKHSTIAASLEAKMVFGDKDKDQQPVQEDALRLQEIADAPKTLEGKDIRSMKDQLLIETTQILGVPLFTAEALLRKYSWSKEQLLQAWVENPGAVCEDAGVMLPENLNIENIDIVHGVPDAMTPEDKQSECGVCTTPCVPGVVMPCDHVFCKDCWQQYFHSMIQQGEAHRIVCPEYGCFKLVPVEMIDRLVSKEMAAKYLSSDIKAFVEANPHIQWCPYPGCDQAILFHPPSAEDSPTHKDSSQVVHCGNRHYFCRDCKEEPHEPCNCDEWKKWLNKAEELAPKIGGKTEQETNDAANQSWLISMCKPCPQCKVQIEKNEGCNHMTCRKCRHEFCWICLDPWKDHNSSTGGYFSCNRLMPKRRQKSCLKEEERSVSLEALKFKRFVHYYDRYKTHKKNLELEKPFRDKAAEKTQELAMNAQCEKAEDLSFIEDAICQLYITRRAVMCSYGYGFFIEDAKWQDVFDRMQGELEEATEALAQVVARPNLRAPRAKIIQLTKDTRTKKKQLIDCIKSRIGTGAVLNSTLNGQLDVESTGMEEDFDFMMPSFLLPFTQRNPFLPANRPPVPVSTPHHPPPATPLAPAAARANSTDAELQRVIEQSRRDFESNRLQEELELAEALSRSREQQPPRPPVSMLEIISHDGTLHEVTSSDDDDDDDKPFTTLGLGHWAPKLQDLSTPPTTTTAAAGFGPLYGEDEDLRRAIELSMVEQQGTPGLVAMPVSVPDLQLPVEAPSHTRDMLCISGPAFESGTVTTHRATLPLQLKLKTDGV